MGKLVLFLSLICLSILIAGSLMIPNDPIMWLAGTSSGFIILRLVVCAALIALLVTNPPRNMVLRYIVGLLAAGLVMTAVMLTYQNQMKWLDSLSLSAAGTAMGIVALEFNYDTDNQKEHAFGGHGEHAKLHRLTQMLANGRRMIADSLDLAAAEVLRLRHS